MTKSRQPNDAALQAFLMPHTSAQPVTEKVSQLPLAQLRPNPYQPRHEFEPAALAELSASIQKSGVFQPIIVRSSIQGYEIIAGERRVRASELAGKTEIPAIIRDVSEADMMEIAVLENLQRENLTPLEEAQAYESLMQNLHLTQAQISEKLGKSRPYIANYLRLLSLPSPTKTMVQNRQLSMGQARTLLGLKDKHRIDPLARKTVKEGLTVRQLEQLVDQLNARRPKTAEKSRFKPKSPFVQEAESLLASKFATKVALDAQKSGKGKIEIDFGSTDDLNRILAMLGISLD